MSSLTTRLSMKDQSAAAVITLHNPLRRIPGVELLNATLGAFDFTVVGGGSAGCVVANGLSEGPGNGIVLLEAGGDTKRTAFEVAQHNSKLTRRRSPSM